MNSDSDRAMQASTSVRNKFKELRCCVIIPTYNHDLLLEDVINGVLEYTDDIIVVNDGSTDRTVEILNKYNNLHIISYRKNRGKGYALQCGFREALKSGFEYAITIDSDGQHYPEDLVKFIDKLEESPGSVILGARNMDQSSVPGTSNFGHLFSIFWFRVETGIKVPDVQTGYRLYPLNRMRNLRMFTHKYEFEVEVLVRLAWKGVNVTSVPVRVYYAPSGERISHFRKFNDFGRVSFINTILVLLGLIWMRPFLFIKTVRKKSFKTFIKEYFINSSDSNIKLASSVALGMFVGVTPIWGFQMLLAFAMAYVFRLNKFVTVAASNISLPPMLPFIIFLSYLSGAMVVGNSTDSSGFTHGITFAWVQKNFLQYIIGSFIFGIILGIVSGTITYFLLQTFRKQKPTSIHKTVN
jgi:glycosyltransferase involved in cell wall biosynthesis